MPAYTFEALQADGKSRKGVIEADTAKAARALLRGQALVPLAVDPVAGGAGGSVLSRPMGGGRAFNSTQLAIWTRQLAGLVGSGLPLERSLTALADESEDERQRNLIANLRAEVNAGSALAKAMAQHPREFSPIYTAVIGAGEQGGHLGAVLDRLADDLEERQTLRAKLIGAAFYPTVVASAGFLIVMFLMSYVVPKVAGVFAGSGRALPLLTHVPGRLVLVSPWIPDYTGSAAAVLAALISAETRVSLTCGAEDKDCLPLAQSFAAQASDAGVPVRFSVIEGEGHVFPPELADLLRSFM